MEQIILWFKEQFAENEVFAGFVGGSLMASVLYMVKSLPMRIWNAVQWTYLRFFTVEVTITNADLTPFLLIANWLNTVVGERWNKVQLDFGVINGEYAHNPDAKLGSNIEKLNRALTLGYGSFGFWHDRTYVRVSRTREEEKGEGRRRPETLTLRFFTRRRDIIDEVLKASQEDVEPMVYNSDSWGGWREYSTVVKRRLETIILPKEQKKRIIGDLEWFFANCDIYKRIGIACTRGYLFHGPPGTGKTTLARALAGYFHRDLYLLSLGDVGSDGNLLQLINEVEKGSFIVFEDVDVVGAVTSRGEDKDEKHGKRATVSLDKGVSLGGLLQALDGVNAGSEHVVIMTTNRPELLDPALKRAGRLDVQEQLDLLPRELGEEMAKAYFDESYMNSLDALSFPTSGAEVEKSLTDEHQKRTHANT